MKKLLFPLLAAILSFGADAAKITSTPSGNLTFSETTEWGDEVVINFRKCMANNLYTFYSIKVNGKELNSSQYSDNIGPFLVNGFWTGGNHSAGNSTTANTLSYSIKVDDESYSKAFNVNGKVLTIDVENELFYSDGEKFATEYMSYVVSGNSIEVYGEHVYEHPNSLNVQRYYGMQSMFIGETEILLPGTDIPTWRAITATSPGNEINITKSSAPDFCTYIEHNANGYQASYMMREGLGNREWVSDNDVVYIGNSYSKSYHKLIGDHPVKKGDRSTWHGVYTWFSEPLTDNCREAGDDHTFEYGAYIEGTPVIMTLGADGRMNQTAGIEDVVVDNVAQFANVSGNTITISADAPEANCFDLSGKIIHQGSGSFSCPPGVYIVNDMRGHSVKLIVK